MKEPREIYKGRVVHLFVHEVPLPNGGSTELEVIRHPGASAVVPFVTPDEILMVRQYRFAAGGWLFEVPAGKLDRGESPESCAMRETEEEVGYRPGKLEHLSSILTTPGFTDEVIHLYAAYDLVESTLRHEEDEVMTVVRMRFAEALAKVLDGTIRDSKSALAILLAAHRRKP